jgi:trimethylamine:corrinoid methyltransferase-like protein
MTQKQLRELQRRARILLRENADDYAEILAMADGVEMKTADVECVLLICGHTPVTFMTAWASGVFDA